MKYKLYKAKIEEKPILKNLIYEYQQELLNTDDPGDYKYLDTYWQKDNRYPYLIEINDKIVGFVLINRHVLITNKGFNVAEFYIHPEFRRKGIGQSVALDIFLKFIGEWEVRVKKKNHLAYKFWSKVIDHFSYGEFKEKDMDGDEWNGQVFSFVSKGK